MVLWRGMQLVITGILLGTLLSFGLARYIQTLIYGVKPIDPTVILESVLTLFIVAVVACLVPAYRASRVDPAVELRSA
jgi:putative ABC transport system permease protein